MSVTWEKFSSDIDIKSLVLLYMFGCAESCKICVACDGCYLEEETMPKSRDAGDTEQCKQSHIFLKHSSYTFYCTLDTVIESSHVLGNIWVLIFLLKCLYVMLT